MVVALGGDGAHPPVLGEEEVTDLDDLRGGDHGHTPPAGVRGRAVGVPDERTGDVGLGPAEELAPPSTAAPAGLEFRMGIERLWRIGTSGLATAKAPCGHGGRARREGGTGRRYPTRNPAGLPLGMRDLTFRRIAYSFARTP